MPPVPGNQTTLICRDCGGPLGFSEEERHSFALLGHHNAPSRCARCREARKARQSIEGSRPVPPGFRERTEIRTSVVCSACGEPTVVPFTVHSNRPVYCSNCYRRRRAEQER